VRAFWWLVLMMLASSLVVSALMACVVWQLIWEE